MSLELTSTKFIGIHTNSYAVSTVMYTFLNSVYKN